MERSALERLLHELVGRLEKTYGDRLVSVVLYGSAAAGEYAPGFSDLNVLCVLSRIGVEELEKADPIFRWWRDKENPSPLLLSVEELKTSTDCFPLEFHDIKERHRILTGEDVVAGMEIDESFYRARVEFELRSKLLRLRQKAAGVLHDRELLLRLLADSVSTFCVLTRHGLRLCGVEAPFAKRAIVAAAAEAWGMNAAPFEKLLDLRDGKVKPKELEPRRLLEEYLAAIGTVVEAVDKVEK